MAKGTVSANILNRSITRHIVKKSDKVYSGAGRDSAVFRGNTYMASSSGFADYSTISKAVDRPISELTENSKSSYITPGVIAEIIAENNMTAAGIIPEYMNIYIVAEEDCSEDKLRREMLELTALAGKRDIAIIGGNTAFSGKGENYSVTINLLGGPKNKGGSGYIQSDSGKAAFPKAGDYVIASGNVGHFGVNLLIEKHYDKLKDRFSKRFLDEARMSEADFRIRSCEELYLMHDISYGGIYRSLYDLSEWTGLGIEIIHEEIPIRQDTIEICEYLNINPYCLFGVGGFVGLCHMEAVEKLKESDDYKNGHLYVVGQLTEKKEKLITSKIYKIRRSLTPYMMDEIYSVIQ
jgi:Hydrogenase maturation factor